MKHGRSELNQRFPLTALFIHCMQRAAKLEGALEAFAEQVLALSSQNETEDNDGIPTSSPVRHETPQGVGGVDSRSVGSGPDDARPGESADAHEPEHQHQHVRGRPHPGQRR